MYLLWKTVDRIRYLCKLCSFGNFEDSEFAIHSNITILNTIMYTTSIMVNKEQPRRNKIMRWRKEIIFLRNMISWLFDSWLSFWTINIKANSYVDFIFSLDYIKLLVRDNLKRLDSLSFVVIVPSIRSTSYTPSEWYSGLVNNWSHL